MLLAEELVKSGDITVITNNLPAAFVLSENPDITLVVCGGTLRHKTRSLHGNITEYALQGIVANLMFVGADGLDAATGITTFNEGYSISGIMAAAAQRVVVVTDSTKFGRRGYNLVLPMEKSTQSLRTRIFVMKLCRRSGRRRRISCWCNLFR